MTNRLRLGEEEGEISISRNRLWSSSFYCIAAFGSTENDKRLWTTIPEKSFYAARAEQKMKRKEKKMIIVRVGGEKKRKKGRFLGLWPARD